jgi:hypothetical protein
MKSLLGALAVVGWLTAATVAADLDEVVARGELIWAADQEGGGPHVFPDPAEARIISWGSWKGEGMRVDGGDGGKSKRVASPTQPCRIGRLRGGR